MASSDDKVKKSTQKAGASVKIPGHTDSPDRTSEDQFDDLLAAYVGIKPSETPELTGIEGFDIVKELGSGGMGAVYEAVQHKPRRDVALKVLKPKYEVLYERLEEEATLSAQLTHPSIARVWEVGRYGERAYICTELVRGFSWQDLTRMATSLRPDLPPDEWLATAFAQLEAGLLTSSEGSRPNLSGPLPGPVVLYLMRTIQGGLEEAHAKKILHLDIKPSNLMLTLDTRGDPVSKIIDFGIAKRSVVSEPWKEETGSFEGTYLYAPPEQLRGLDTKLGPHSDVYALAVTWLVLRTGKRPFNCTTLAQRLDALDALPVAEVFDALGSGAERDVIRTALHPDYRLRYSDCGALLDRLERAISEPTDLSRVIGRFRRDIQKTPPSSRFLLVVFVLASLFFWAEQETSNSLYQRLDADYEKKRIALKAFQEDWVRACLQTSSPPLPQSSEDASTRFEVRVDAKGSVSLRFSAKSEVEPSVLKCRPPPGGQPFAIDIERSQLFDIQAADSSAGN